MGEGGTARLLRERRFAPFFWVQFCGALNDNIFKVGFSSLLTYDAAHYGVSRAQIAAFLISAAFVLPFIPFSATCGQVADKYDKARVTRWVKTFEIGVMLCACAGFALHSAALLFACTFAMGLHSTVFGPVKYAYLPQHLAPRELVAGNGLVESGTFVAILLGTILGGAGAALGRYGGWVIGGVTLGVAIVGRLLAVHVPASPAPQPELRVNWNPVSETVRNLRLAAEDRTLLAGLLGISWLWFVGATLLASFFSFAKDVLGADAAVVTLLLASFSIGIAAGSLACARLSGPQLEIGLTPLGLVGMTACGVELFFASHHFPHGAAPASIAAFLAQPAGWRVLLDLFLLAACGGIYSVPLYALIQTRGKPTHRARIIAANNILNALFMVVSALCATLLTALGGTIPQLYLITSLLNLAVGLGFVLMAPEFIMAAGAWLGARVRRRRRSGHEPGAASDIERDGPPH